MDADSEKLRQLEHSVQRWQNRKMEKEEQRRTLPTKLPSAVITAPSTQQKLRKPIARRPDDDATVAACVSLANRQLLQHNKQTTSEPKRLKMLDVAPREDQLRERRIQINTYMKPLEDFAQEHPETAVVQLDESDDTRNVISGSTFPTLRDPLTLLDKQRSYWDFRNAERIRKGIKAAPKDTVSAKHIAKVLFEPYGYFSPCLMAELGQCMAQVDSQLRHPVSEAPKPCMGYVTPDEMHAVELGLATEPFLGNLCEFCTRYRVNYETKRRALESHVSEHEVPSHYYKSGMPGEYSKDAMIQSAPVKGVTHTDGIFGDVRSWNTADFVPVVGVIEPGQSLVSKIIDVAQYTHMSSSQVVNSGNTYVCGWQEIGGLYSLNEHALLETRRVDPYTRTIIDTDQQIDICVSLGAYFKQRATPNGNDDYSHVFDEFMTCCNDSSYLDKPYPDPPSNITRWLPNCLHDIANEPKYATHSIYYTLLVKINTCSEILRRWSTTDEKGVQVSKGVPNALKQKLSLFHDAHTPLLRWMHDNKAISNDELLEPRYDEELGFDTNIVFQLYPKFPVHYRVEDVRYMNFVRKDFVRSNPLEIASWFYVAEVKQRLEYKLHGNLPLIDTLLGAHSAENLSKAGYGRLQATFDKLCTTLNLPLHNLWPQLETLDADENELLGSESARQKWKTKRNAQTLRDMRNAFSVALEMVEDKNREYRFLVENFNRVVFCDFDYTVKWLSEMSHANRASIIESCELFHSVLPPESGIMLFYETVNGEPWQDHCILLSILLRVYVMERLHTLEPPHRETLRQNLILLRNSHLALLRSITVNRLELLNDADLREKTGALSKLELYAPTPTREIHPGLLPDLVNGLVYVNFMGDAGMDHHPWIKIQFKKPKRCCGGREFSEMLRAMCAADDAFYRYTCLELELSLKGLYRHNTVAPSFYRTLALDELFDNIDNPAVRERLFTFILENQTLVTEATSESLVYLLEFAPHLRDILSEVYQDWFAWRIKANMDMVRQCYNDNADFSRVNEIVYERVQLKSSESVYRHSEIGFVDFMCNQIKDFDVKRYSLKVVFEAEHKLSPRQKLIIDRFVTYISPDQEINLVDMKLLDMNATTLDVVAEIFNIFKNTGLKSNGASAKKESSDAAVQEQFLKLTGNQYILLSYFFETLKRYQNIRAIRITNLNVINAQIEQLCKRRGVERLEQIPALATKLAYSWCCNYIKNSFPIRAGSDARGFDTIMLDVQSGAYTCGKKPTKTKRPTRVQAIRLGKSGALFKKKIARQQQREEKKPLCKNTEILFVDLVGEVVESCAAAKIPKSKKPTDPNKRRKKNLSLPSGPFWITPCCGISYSYDWSRITPNGYACGVCVENTEVAESLNQLLCTACHSVLVGDRYEVLRIYDDVYTDSFRRMLYCNSCLRPWRFFPRKNLLASFILRGSHDQGFVSDICENI